MNRPKPLFERGDPVVLWSDSRNKYCTKEYGRIYRKRWHKVVQAWQYTINFFGNKWPKNERWNTKTYRLRYFETSLRLYTPPKRKK